MVPELLRAPAEALVRPADFFEESPRAFDLAAAALVVFALAVATAAGVYVVGALFATHVDHTVSVENPERPPDWVCEGHDDSDAMHSNCEEPERVDVHVGEEVAGIATDRVPWAFFAIPLVWALAGVALFATSRALGGSGEFADTLAVAGWTALPEFLRLGVGLVAVDHVLRTHSHSGSPESWVRDLEVAFAAVDPVMLAVAIVVALLQWRMLARGLAAAHDVPPENAALAAGIPLVLALFFALP